MGINFKKSPSDVQFFSQVFHAMGQKPAHHETSSNDWEWVTGVTMTAARTNSTYHITVSGNASANGSNNGKGIPYIRVRRGNTNTYVGSNSNGIEGRKSENNNQNDKNKYDGGLFSFTVKDEPGLRTGDTVTYSLQLKCNKEGSGNFNASIGRFPGEGHLSGNTTGGASLNVKEIAPEIGISDATIRDFDV